MSTIGQIAVDIVADASSYVAAMGKVEQQTQQTSSSVAASASQIEQAFSAIKAGIVGSIAFKAAEVALDMGRAGAEALRTEASFNSLAAHAGESGQAMLAAMKTATGGTIAEMDLMQGANYAMVQGIAKNSQQMADLTQIAVFKGRQMGLSSAQSIDELFRALATMSVERFDNIGLSSSSIKAALDDYARSAGTTADKLTDLEKKQVGINAVIRDGKKDIEDAGGVLQDYASQFERTTAQIEDSKKRINIALAAPTAGLMGWVADALDKLTSKQFGQDEAAHWGATTTGPQDNTLQLAERRLAVLKELAKQDPKLGQASQADADALMATAQANVDAANAAALHARALAMIGSAAGDASGGITSVASAAAGASPLLAGAATRAVELANALAGAYGSFQLSSALGRVQELYKAQEDYAQQYADYQDRLAEAGASAGMARLNQRNAALKSAVQQVQSMLDGLMKHSGIADTGMGEKVDKLVGYQDTGNEEERRALAVVNDWDAKVTGPLKAKFTYWRDYLKSTGLIPEEVFAQGKDAVQKYLATQARDFDEYGLGAGKFLDKGAIKERLKKQLAGQAQIAQIRNELLHDPELSGINLGMIDSALGNTTLGSILPNFDAGQLEAQTYSSIKPPVQKAVETTFADIQYAQNFVKAVQADFLKLMNDPQLTQAARMALQPVFQALFDPSANLADQSKVAEQVFRQFDPNRQQQLLSQLSLNSLLGSGQGGKSRKMGGAIDENGEMATGITASIDAASVLAQAGALRMADQVTTSFQAPLATGVGKAFEKIDYADQFSSALSKSLDAAGARIEGVMYTGVLVPIARAVGRVGEGSGNALMDALVKALDGRIAYYIANQARRPN